MAKGKRATALFEVMSKAKSAGGGPGRPGGGIPTPKWWFRSTNRGEVKTLAPTTSDTGDIPEDIPQPVEKVRRLSPPLATSIDVPESTPTAPAPRVQPFEVAVDSDRQQINLRLSYTSALIGGFGLCVLVGIAILIGKSLSKGPAAAVADVDTRVLRQGPANPGVANVSRRPDAGGVREEDNSRGPSTGTRTPQQPQNGFNEPRPPSTFFTDDPRRQFGLNYMIVQSYPDRDTAKKVAEFLTSNGVPCTVESNLPNWRLAQWPEGCTVVGLRGFSKIQNNPAFDQYKKLITDLSSRFTANGRTRFMSFQPQPYKWQRQ